MSTRNTSSMDSSERLGLSLAVVALCALVVCIASFAAAWTGPGIAAAVVTLATFGAAMAWLNHADRIH